MSKRVTRSMTTGDKPKTKATEAKIDDSKFDPLGHFSVLPIEIIHEILSRLPTVTIANLALASREWQKILRDWIDRKQTIHRFVQEISEYRTQIPQSKQQLKKEESYMGLIGDILRRATISTPFTQNVYWMPNVLQKVREQWNSRKGGFRILGFFLKSLLKSSSDEELRIAVEAVCHRQLLPVLLPAGAGLPYLSKSMRCLINELFPEDRIILTAAHFLLEGVEPSHKAHYAQRLFISEDDVTDQYHLLASLLNMWWRENKEETLTVVHCVLKWPGRWRHYRVASLFAELDVELGVRLLEGDQDKIERVLVAMAEINGEATVRLLQILRKRMSDADSNAVVSHIYDRISKEVEIITKRCRLCSHSAELSDSPFVLLHNLELVRTATGRMRLKSCPQPSDQCRPCD